MADGKGTRWNNYLNITKQEIIINGENLLERMVRQIRKLDKNAKIIISSHNPYHKIAGCMLYASEDDNKYKKCIYMKK